jgi:hypothetical protein
MTMLRRSTPRFLVVPTATSADDTSGEHESALTGRAPSLQVTDEADLDPAATVAEPVYNGVWGVDANENVSADNNLGAHSKGFCSRPGGLERYGCGSNQTSLKRLLLPSLSVAAPSGDPAATASASSEAALGLLTASVAVTADFSSPDTSGSVSSVNLTWGDTITPPAATKKHPLGSTYKLDVTLTLTDEGETLDCSEFNTATYEAQVDIGSGASITGGCSPSGSSPSRLTVDATWGGPSVSIGGSLAVTVQASAATASWSTSLPAIKARVDVRAPSKVAYTTGSGKCYGDSGDCF